MIRKTKKAIRKAIILILNANNSIRKAENVILNNSKAIRNAHKPAPIAVWVEEKHKGSSEGN